jgi:hypothetical protein
MLNDNLKGAWDIDMENKRTICINAASLQYISKTFEGDNSVVVIVRTQKKDRMASHQFTIFE